MSLLNDALRKNRSENSNRTVFDFSAQEIRGPGKPLLLVIVFFAAACGLILLWLNRDDNFFETVEGQPQTAERNIISTTEPTPEVTKIPVNAIPLKAEMEEKEKKDFPERKRVDGTGTGNSEPVRVEGISKPAEKTSLRKKEEVSESVDKETTDNGDGYYNKALQFHRQGRSDQAIAMYKKALSYNPSNPDALFNIASIYITISRYGDAYNILKKLLDINSSDSKAVLNLAIAEIGLGKNRDAISDLNEIHDEDVEMQFKISFHKGVALSQIGKPDEALICYKKAEKYKGDYPGLLLNMALLYDKLGNYNEAINYYSKLIESASLDSKEKEKYRQRIETLRNCVSVYPVKTSS